jgi:citrate synthase
MQGNESVMKSSQEHRPTETIRTAVGAQIQHPEHGSLHICHGYDLFNDLLGKYSWLELTLLHLNGELPGKREVGIVDFLFACVINPGPKHHATQAAMTAAVTHTPVGNSLLVGLAVLEGRHRGALEVEQAMLFFCELAELAAGEAIHYETLCKKYPDLPGFEQADAEKAKQMKTMLARLEKRMGPYGNTHLQAVVNFAEEKKIQVSPIGLFAVGMVELGYEPRQGHGLYMIAAAPGILAHLLEQMKGDWRTYPFGEPLLYEGPKGLHPDPDKCCYRRRK